MAWSKPFTEIEIAYIEKAWPKLSCAAIARKLGRSQRGVENQVNRLGLRDGAAPRADARSGGETRAREDAPPARDADEAQDELADLRELKRRLRRMIKDDIDPRAMPKLSAEYRDVMKRIDELERGGDGRSGASGQDGGNLVVSIPLQPA